MIKTNRQIEREVEKLKATRTELDDYDWNKIIDAQIYVLEHRIDRNTAFKKYKGGVSEKALTLILYACDWMQKKPSKADVISTIRQVEHCRIVEMLDLEIGVLNNEGMPGSENDVEEN